MKPNKFAAAVIAALSLPLCHADTLGYTAKTAPDAVSRDVLGHWVFRPEEGAANVNDIPLAINRNYPKIIEQNIASRHASAAIAWLDQMSDLELEHIAQLYVNANASTARTGKLLQIAAARFDGPRLGRLSKFFGNAEVRAAVASVAPQKLSSFEANTSVAFVAPVIGAALSAPLTVSAATAAQVAVADATAAAHVTATPEAIAMAGSSFTPAPSMTLDQIYTGFRTMQVGGMATEGAIYETASYAGKQLIVAWGIGYAFGSGITYLMQEYEPDWAVSEFKCNTADEIQGQH